MDSLDEFFADLIGSDDEYEFEYRRQLRAEPEDYLALDDEYLIDDIDDDEFDIAEIPVGLMSELYDSSEDELDIMPLLKEIDALFDDDFDEIALSSSNSDEDESDSEEVSSESDISDSDDDDDDDDSDDDDDDDDVRPHFFLMR
jgi:segregation and condensation protein B